MDDDEKLENVTKIKYDKILMEMREKLSPNAIKLTCMVLNNFFKFIKKYYIPNFDVVLEFKLSKDEKVREKQRF